MGKGQGNSQPQQVTSTNTTTTSNLPEYARPYFESLMQRAQEVSNDPYQAYTGQRVAGFNRDQEAAFNNIRSAQGWAYPSFAKADSAYGKGLGAYDTAMGYAQNGEGFDPERVTNTYQAREYNPDQWTDAGVSQRYMSPYMQNVIDIDTREAERQFGIQETKNEAAAQAGGAYGGYRHGIVDAEAQRNHLINLADIQNRGLQSAYESGVNTFDRDRSSLLASNDLNNRFNQEQSRLGMSATNANNSWALEGQKLDLSRGDLATRAGAGYAGLGGAYTNLGQSTQDAAYKDANALLGIGGIRQAQDQYGLDTAYQDFQNQRDYSRQNLNWLSSIIRGVPISANTNVTSSNYAAAPNASSQIAGLGLGGIGLSRLFNS